MGKKWKRRQNQRLNLNQNQNQDQIGDEDVAEKKDIQSRLGWKKKQKNKKTNSKCFKKAVVLNGDDIEMSSAKNRFLPKILLLLLLLYKDSQVIKI